MTGAGRSTHAERALQLRGYLRFKLAQVQGDFERFVMLIQRLSNLRQSEPAMWAHRLQRCGFFKRIGGLLMLPRIHQNQRQTVPGAVDSWVNRQRLAKRNTGLAVLPDLLQGIAEIEPAGSFLRACLREQAQALDSCVKPSPLRVNVCLTCQRMAVKWTKLE